VVAGITHLKKEREIIPRCRIKSRAPFSMLGREEES
jgi:hypothetical protein